LWFRPERVKVYSLLVSQLYTMWQNIRRIIFLHVKVVAAWNLWGQWCQWHDASYTCTEMAAAVKCECVLYAVTRWATSRRRRRVSVVYWWPRSRQQCSVCLADHWCTRRDCATETWSAHSIERHTNVVDWIINVVCPSPEFVLWCSYWILLICCLVWWQKISKNRRLSSSAT